MSDEVTMFILTNNDLPITAITFNNNCIASILTPITTLTNSGLISKLFNNITTTITDVVVGVIPNTYEIEVDSLPSAIITTDKIFTLAVDINNPVNSEFIYVNNKVVIYSSTTITNVTIVNSPIVKSLQIPAITGLAGLPVLSSINITESFQDHPTATISLVTSTNYIAQVRNLFKLSSLFKLGKYEFIVNSYNEEISNNDDILRVNLNLRGKWDNYVNYLIPLNSSITASPNFTDTECQVTNISNSSSFNRYLNINEISKKIGVEVRGITFNVINDNTDINSSVTISNLLNDYVDINSAFVDYSNPEYILVKKLDNVNNWTYYDDQIISNFNTTINRTNLLPTVSSYSSINDSINYNSLVPATITNKTSTIATEDVSIIPYPVINNAVVNAIVTNPKVNDEEQTKDNEPSFRLRKPIKRTYYKGDLNASICPPNINTLKTLDLNHDRSGVTKTITYIVEEDNNPISEVTRRYGFAYTAWDITLISGDFIELNSLAASWWTLIEETVTNYFYDNATGYLLGYNTKGRKLIRPQVETEDNYTQLYNLAINDAEEPSAFDTATYNTYIFRFVPVRAAKRYQLAQHRDYYQQFESQAKYIKRCNKDGSSSYVIDPTYIEPMFVIAESEQYSCFLSVSNPANIDRESEDPIQPPLTSGQETYNRTILQILPSRNSRRNQFGSLFDSEFKGEDSYITYTSNFTAQDPGFRAVTEETSDSTNTGIPAVHTRKPSKYELIEPDKENQEVKEPSNYIYVFWTDPFTGGYPRTSGQSFDKARSFSDVQNGIINQLKIDDIRSTLTSTMTIPYNGNISTGDKITVIFNGLHCYRRVISINHSIEQNYTNEGIITTAVTNLTMGIDRAITVNSKIEKVVKPYNPTNQTPTPNPGFGNPYYKGFILGSLLPNVLGRGS